MRFRPGTLKFGVVTRNMPTGEHREISRKTCCNLMQWRIEDVVDWSTLLSILPKLTGEEDVLAGGSRVLTA